MAVMNKAPHASATKLFVNWILSKEGQSAWQKYTEVNSLRNTLDAVADVAVAEGAHQALQGNTERASAALLLDYRGRRLSLVHRR